MYGKAKEKAAEMATKAQTACNEAADKAKTAYADAAPLAAQAGATAAQAAKSAATTAEQGCVAVAGEERVGAAKGAAAGAKAQASAYAGKAADAAREKVADLEEAARGRAVDIVTAGVDAAVAKVGVKAKDSLVDPDMPAPVAYAAVAFVDSALPELKGVILETLANKFRKAVEDDDLMTAAPPPCCPNVFAFLRAFVLYHMFPHDKTIWAKLRDPWWWLFTVGLGSFPLYGVHVCWWAVVLLCKDRRDEYQLVDFVVSFKAAQFISGGVQAMMVGSILYTTCIPNCTGDEAPGNHPNFRVELLFFLVKGGLCWLALLMLPWSEVKGGRLYVPLKSDPDLARKGGRVWNLMYYDLLVFAACLGLGLQVYADADKPGWVQDAQLFHIKALYGVLSFPWFILKLPLLYTVILGLKPTLYNRRGDTVRPANAKEKRAARDKRVGARVHPGDDAA